MDKYTGKRLDGRYEIQELIGVGGMAMVYKAYDNLDDKTVAIKILKDEFLGNQEFIRRFKNESKAIAVLSHPNIVKVYDVSFGDRIQYIVMEYIDGITLKEYIGQQNVIPWKEAVHFTVQILQALQHAHEKGIVHRDVKPQNIMLLQDGTIKVTDFGIARFSNNETRTMTDKAIGSVHYIAPEQARGGVTDGKADIYSVGVMLYEMLTGKLPFDADSAVSVAIMQLQTEPKPLREINADIPEGIEEITLKAMRKEPRQRYGSAKEMLEAIETFRRNPAIKFDYNYSDDNTKTKYVESIGKVSEPKPVETYREDMNAYYDDEVSSSKAKTAVKWITILVGVLVLAALIFFMFQVVQNLTKQEDAKTVDVPNFLHMNYEDIMKDKSYKFNFVVIDKNEGEELNTVVGQEPEAGSKKVKENATIKLMVYTNKQKVEVPKLKNYSESKAVEKLNEKGFTSVDIQRVYSSSEAAGTVIDSSPQETTKQYPDTVITLIVSDGPVPEQIIIPDVSGKSYEKAKADLEALRFQTERSDEPGDLEAGIVIGTDPLPGNKVQVNKKIKIKVSDGSKIKKNLVFTVDFLPREEYGEIRVVVYENKSNGKDEKLFDDVVTPSNGTQPSFEISPEGAVNNKKKLTVKVDGVVWATVTLDFENGSQTPNYTDEKEHYKIKVPSLIEEKKAALEQLQAHYDNYDFSQITDKNTRLSAKSNIKGTLETYGEYDEEEEKYSGKLFNAMSRAEIDETLEEAIKELDSLFDYYLALDEPSDDESSEEDYSDDESSEEDYSDDESSEEDYYDPYEE